MTKEEILNGMSEEEFYRLYPDQESWENAQQMKLGGLSGAPHNGQPTADEFFSYGSHANDGMNIPMSNPFYLAHGGTPYYGGPLYPAQDGGDYNSPTNYGSFNVVMQTGGMTAEDWARKEQESIINKTGQGIPNKVKPTQANQYMYNPFIKGSDIQTYDSTHVSPIDPNLASYFKGNKMIVGPAANTTTSKRAAADFNKNKIYEKSGSAYPIYQEYGGVLNQDNMMDYPTFETGGRSILQNIIKAASKNMKKAYGGDTVTQGGNSDNYPQSITSAFKNAIKKNTMNALINEQQEEMSKHFMQMGGYQTPELNAKNQALQNMYQYNIDQGNENARYDFNNLLGASDYLTATANPYTKTTVKAKDGLDMSKYSAEELQQLEKLFGKKARGNNYYSGYGQGMPYFPMNYNPYMKMSKKDVGLMQQLAANPSTNLKEFSHRHFGPWGKTKMTFGYKDQTPFTEYKGDNIQVDLKNNPDNFNFQEQASIPLTGPRVDNTSGNDGLQSFIPKQILMDSQFQRYGGLSKAQYGKDHKSTNPSDGTYDNYGNQIGSGSATGNMGLTSNPIGMGSSFTPVGNAPGAASANISYQGTPTPSFSTPESVGLQHQNVEMKGMGTGEKQATITSKFRPGFNGEAIANWGIAGINALSSGLEQIQSNAKNKKKLNELQLADNSFVATPANAQSRGDYDPNSGMFRPNNMVPVQFSGYGAYGGSFEQGGAYQEGEELDLSPEEIEELRSQGYDVEFLD